MTGREATRQQVVAEVLLRQYESEYQASHLTWRDFATPADEILAALDALTPPARESSATAREQA